MKMYNFHNNSYKNDQILKIVSSSDEALRDYLFRLKLQEYNQSIFYKFMINTIKKNNWELTEEIILNSFNEVILGVKRRL